MAIEKITTPLSGKELSGKINEIIAKLGIGDIADIKIEDNKLILVKANEEDVELDITNITRTASADNDGILTKEDYIALQNIKNALADGTVNVAPVIPYATCPTQSNVYDKVATVINNVAFTLKQGAMVMVAFQYAPYVSGGHALRLNVNETGLKNITYSGISGAYYTPANTANRLMFVYDGVNWVCTNPYTYTYSEPSDSGGGDA